MEDSAVGMWPLISLIVAVVAFVAGMMFGKPRTMAAWGGGNPCNVPCDCGGINCTIPTGPGQRHQHCPNQGTEATGCPGKCDNSAGPGHAGIHHCSHGHTF